MMGSEGRLTLDVNVRVEAREGHWAASMEQFPIMVYGDSPQSAEHRALDALMMMLTKYAGSASTLSEYLTARGVSHVTIATPVIDSGFRPYVVAQSHHRVSVPVGV